MKNGFLATALAVAVAFTASAEGEKKAAEATADLWHPYTFVSEVGKKVEKGEAVPSQVLWDAVRAARIAGNEPKARDFLIYLIDHDKGNSALVKRALISVIGSVGRLGDYKRLLEITPDKNFDVFQVGLNLLYNYAHNVRTKEFVELGVLLYDTFDSDECHTSLSGTLQWVAIHSNILGMNDGKAVSAIVNNAKKIRPVPAFGELVRQLRWQNRAKDIKWRQLYEKYGSYVWDNGVRESFFWSAPDDKALDVQALVDAAAAKGGGEVAVPAGRWDVKPFVLRSNVTLRLDDRAEIYASVNPDDYSDEPGKRCFVYAENATNVAIVGKGLFYGSGYRFRQLKALPGESQPQALPVMLRFSRCRDVRLEDVTLCSCGAWGCHLRNCDGAVVRRMKILNHVNNTNDGLDIESSNVLVEDCDIDADDDAVCLKNESDPSFPVTNVVVRNCRLATCANAFKIGTGTYGDVRDVLVEDCAFVRPKANYGWILYRQNPGVTNRLTGMAGIALECIDGGRVEDITVRNVTMEGYGTPVFIRAQRRHEPPAGRTACLRKLLIENVKAVADSRIASSITGVPGLRPQDITIRNVDFLMPGGGTAEEARRPVPESEKV